jgi:hypothetical protein
MERVLTQSERELVNSATLDIIADEGVHCMTGDRWHHLCDLANPYSFNGEYAEIQRHIENNDWHRISNDELKIFAMELQRRRR